jgi:two-component system response regulator PilR (NtrC family)
MNEERTARILLLEDNPDDVFLLQQALLRPPSKWEVLHAELLKEALDILRGGHVDIILTDLRVPDGMGLEIVQKLSEAAAGAPIIVFTGCIDDHLQQELTKAGASECLVKTADYGPIVELVRHTLEEREHEAQRLHS